MRPITYGSVCSGIEAATTAWHGLGWSPQWFAEIEAFPSAVLAHHWPDVPNLGDFTAIRHRIAAGEVEAPDILVGGTPCQAFSVAGLRRSLDDQRGQLTLQFVGLADAIDSARHVRGAQPCTIVWENVPGVLNTPDNAFGCFLAGLVGEDDPLVPPGGRWTNVGYVRGPRRTVAWRILDAQYFGVAQRRRRVFVVASAGGLRPEQVLFELDGVRPASPPSREAGQGFAPPTGHRSGERSHWEGGPHPSLNQSNNIGGVGMSNQELFSQRGDYLAPQLVAFAQAVTGDVFHTLRAEGHDASEDGTGRGVGAVAVSTLAIRGRGDGCNLEVRNDRTANAILTPSGGRAGIGVGAVAIHRDVAPTLTRNYGKQPDSSDTNSGPMVLPTQGMQVRRLTPTECERLQGFPDGHTRIPWRGRGADECPDGPRYKALGNSMAVPVMRWIGARIARLLEVSR